MKEMFGQVIFILHSFNFLVQSDFHFLRLPDLSYYLSETEMNQETIFTFLSICFSFKLDPHVVPTVLPSSAPCGSVYLSELTRGWAGDSELIRYNATTTCQGGDRGEGGGAIKQIEK